MMFEVLCELCLHTEGVDGNGKPDFACPNCGVANWLGPFFRTPQRFSRRNSRLVLTSSHYVHAGQTERRMHPR